MTLYPDLKETYCKKYWSKVLNVSFKQFRTSAIIIGKHPTKRLSCGVCSIEVYNRKLKEKIFTWFKLYQKYFDQIGSHVIIPGSAGVVQ